ncbi:MAG: ABC transporter ATP-binding protein [Acidimicrobiia bacterium]
MRVEVSAVHAALGGLPILNGIDLSIGSGEMVSLVGPNGSGKSTLLRCIYRVLRPTAGRVDCGGTDVWASDQRQSARSIAVLVQEPQGEFDFEVFDMVLMGRTPHLGLFDRFSADDRTTAEAALATVDASHLARRRFRTLSGGEKQRVLLARALTQQPEVLVLDEPTNHLDIQHQLELLEIVRRLGITVIAALHDLNLAARYSDRVCVLSGGRVVGFGAPAEVLTVEVISSVFRVAATVTIGVGNAPQFTFSPLSTI